MEHTEQRTTYTVRRDDSGQCGIGIPPYYINQYRDGRRETIMDGLREDKAIRIATRLQDLSDELDGWGFEVSLKAK